MKIAKFKERTEAFIDDQHSNKKLKVDYIFSHKYVTVMIHNGLYMTHRIYSFDMSEP